MGQYCLLGLVYVAIPGLRNASETQALQSYPALGRAEEPRSPRPKSPAGKGRWLALNQSRA